MSRVGKALAAMTVAALSFGGLVAASAPAQAAAGDVVINELLYSELAPASSDFLELFNRGSESVDISGWSFYNITLDPASYPGSVFPAGTVIPPGGYLVGAADPTAFATTYGRPADFSFLGTGLSSKGEEVVLCTAADAGACSPTVTAAADRVAYGVTAPWPSSPNGTGPSLELVDPFADNNVAANWGASTVVNGTPGAQNSVFNVPQVQLTEVTATPSEPAPDQPFVVSARTAPDATVSLTYKVMYGTETTIPMLDDAASPGGAGDGVFAATIPGVGAGQLVRYRVIGVRGDQTVSDPGVGDAMRFRGVVVTDPARKAQYPVFEWFIEESVFQDMLANHRCDDYFTPTAFAFKGQVFDNVPVRIKGHHSCNDLEPKWEFNLPAGHLFTVGAPFAYAVDEFNLESNSVPVPQIGWEMSGTAGQPVPKEQTVRVQKNGQFYSIAAILEKYDNVWRANHDYDTWAVYKVQAGGLRTYATPDALAASLDIEKKTPDDGNYSDVWELTQWLTKADSEEKRTWIRNNLDLPEMANVTALIVAMRQWDTVTKNFYVVKDINGTGRWRILQWDLDDILNAGADPKGGDFVTPPLRLNNLFISLFQLPDYQQMHYRRVRTLHDQFLVGDRLLQRFDQLTTCCTADFALDTATWGNRTLTQYRNRFIRAVQERRDMIGLHTVPGEIPPSQSAAPGVVINEIQYNPSTGGDGEFIELANPSTTESVDLSGWVLDGPGTYPIPDGTVLEAGGYVVFVKSDVAFRAAYPGTSAIVGGQYSGSLANEGEAITLSDRGGRLVDTVTYGPTDPWPTAPNGTGPSLELTSPDADNALPQSWAASTGTGTPGALNSASVSQPVWSVLKEFGTTWKYLATGPDQGTAWRASAFDDSAWPSGHGDFGFKNNNRTTIPATIGRATYYFRSTVTVPAGNPIQGAKVNVKVDDGAVVYVNGVEVARYNMGTAAVAFTTLAKSPIDGDAELAVTSLAIPKSALKAGTNVVAVEVHQRATRSAADLTWDGQVNILR